eukprot:scaffold30552_cov70-Phaeocystis_antarctica.AAC.2
MSERTTPPCSAACLRKNWAVWQFLRTPSPRSAIRPTCSCACACENSAATEKQWKALRTSRLATPRPCSQRTPMLKMESRWPFCAAMHMAFAAISSDCFTPAP